MPRRPYEIRPITAADTDAVMATGAAAFKDEPIQRALFPTALVDPASAKAEDEFRRRHLAKRLRTPRAVLHLIVADDGVTVAGRSAWVAPAREGEGAAGAGDEDPYGEPPACVRRELFDELLRMFKEKKEELLGPRQDFWYLTGLATHPDHQRKGVAAALVGWGIEQSEKDGLPVYVESTPTGLPLYLKLGFKVVDEVDMSKWIADGREYKTTFMIRMPGGK